MLKYKQIWHGIKPIKWLIKFNLTERERERERERDGMRQQNPGTVARERG